jgi:lipocalin
LIAFTTPDRVYLIHESDLSKFTTGAWYQLYRRGLRCDDRSVRVDAVYKRTASVRVTDPGGLRSVIQRGDELRRIER